MIAATFIAFAQILTVLAAEETKTPQPPKPYLLLGVDIDNSFSSVRAIYKTENTQENTSTLPFTDVNSKAHSRFPLFYFSKTRNEGTPKNNLVDELNSLGISSSTIPTHTSLYTSEVLDSSLSLTKEDIQPFSLRVFLLIDDIHKRLKRIFDSLTIMKNKGNSYSKEIEDKIKDYPNDPLVRILKLADVTLVSQKEYVDRVRSIFDNKDKFLIGDYQEHGKHSLFVNCVSIDDLQAFYKNPEKLKATNKSYNLNVSKDTLDDISSRHLEYSELTEQEQYILKSFVMEAWADKGSSSVIITEQTIATHKKMQLASYRGTQLSMFIRYTYFLSHPFKVLLEERDCLVKLLEESPVVKQGKLPEAVKKMTSDVQPLLDGIIKWCRAKYQIALDCAGHYDKEMLEEHSTDCGSKLLETTNDPVNLPPTYKLCKKCYKLTPWKIHFANDSDFAENCMITSIDLEKIHNLFESSFAPLGLTDNTEPPHLDILKSLWKGLLGRIEKSAQSQLTTPDNAFSSVPKESDTPGFTKTFLFEEAQRSAKAGTDEAPASSVTLPIPAADTSTAVAVPYGFVDPLWKIICKNKTDTSPLSIDTCVLRPVCQLLASLNNFSENASVCEKYMLSHLHTFDLGNEAFHTGVGVFNDITDEAAVLTENSYTPISKVLRIKELKERREANKKNSSEKNERELKLKALTEDEEKELKREEDMNEALTKINKRLTELRNCRRRLDLLDPTVNTPVCAFSVISARSDFSCGADDFIFEIIEEVKKEHAREFEKALSKNNQSEDALLNAAVAAFKTFSEDSSTTILRVGTEEIILRTENLLNRWKVCLLHFDRIVEEAVRISQQTYKKVHFGYAGHLAETNWLQQRINKKCKAVIAKKDVVIREDNLPGNSEAEGALLFLKLKKYKEHVRGFRLEVDPLYYKGLGILIAQAKKWY